jgi:fermentation-respiration switch protein FrsA (DUF1100 family)
MLIAHGNGGNLTYLGEVLLALHQRLDVSVLIFDYRGYGRSAGKPTVPGILDDARAARAWLAQRAGVNATELVLYGESLGGAVVVDLAADGARGLVLESTFNSLGDVAGWHFPWLPTRLILGNTLNSQGTIGRYHGPLLQIHGDADRTVPMKFGRRLYDAANAPKQWVQISGGIHSGRRTPQMYAALDRFLQQLPRGNGQ